jgi:hypothetical protein
MTGSEESSTKFFNYLEIISSWENDISFVGNICNNESRNKTYYKIMQTRSLRLRNTNLTV